MYDEAYLMRLLYNTVSEENSALLNEYTHDSDTHAE